MSDRERKKDHSSSAAFPLCETGQEGQESGANYSQVGGEYGAEIGMRSCYCEYLRRCTGDDMVTASAGGLV
jgi:hypothetical protein